MAASKKVVALQVGGQTVNVTMQRHHWSRRLTLSISRGQVRLSLPPSTPWYLGESFLNKSQAWLQKHLETTGSAPSRRIPTAAERRTARRLVETKLEQWQPYFDKAPVALRIANQGTRWGSCSARGTLSFNWRVIELPDRLSDYITVHELAHLIEANHGPQFWALVGKCLPDYKDLRRRLKAFALHD